MSFTFRVPFYDIRYDFHIKTMFGSSLPPVVCRRAHVLFTLFVFTCAKGCLFLIAPSIFSNVYIS